MKGITVKIWPRGTKSRTLDALRHCLGDDPVLLAFDQPAAARLAPHLAPHLVGPASEPAASGVELVRKRYPAQVPGRRYLVEYEDFPVTVVARFEQAVTAGQAEDSAVGFRRFASEDFSRYTAFLTHWVNSDFVQDQIVINATDLYETPGPWLHWALGMLNPDTPPTTGQLDKISARAPDWIAANPVFDLTGFRYYDTDLFEKLGRLALPRETVLQVFRDMLGRIPKEDAILNFQCMDSRVTLRRQLFGSQEYVQRASEAMTALGSYDRVTPQVLSSPAYKRWEFAHKTKLGWPLNQVFISRKAGLIYCPIGKVACTFLKRQMVHISDVAHKAEILKDVHTLTDKIRTGLQLSDYPQAEADAFIADPGIVKFAVLRDPRARLLSAYIEKFVINRTAANNILHTSPVLAAAQNRTRKGSCDAETGITFREFITEITAQPSYKLDPHWRPQVDYLNGISYDRIFQFEAMDAVIDLLEARSGQTLSRQPQNVTGSGHGATILPAADLLPTVIMALPKLDKSGFFDEALDTAIAEYFSDDLALLQISRDEVHP